MPDTTTVLWLVQDEQSDQNSLDGNEEQQFDEAKLPLPQSHRLAF
jgi:hypothetical protein